MALDLLSATSRVETPFIIAEIGGVSFGAYSTRAKNVLSGNTYYNSTGVTYPNFMKSLTIDKINGTVNTYKLVMEYQIRQGDDPNLLEKVFSKIKDSRTIFLSYGDMSMPSYIYRREEVLVTGITSNLDFAGSKITYNLSCTSKSLLGNIGKFNFPKRVAKPSDIIKEILYNNTYNLLEVFTGMSNKYQVLQNNLIASDDAEVTVEAKVNVTPIEYLNYLVKCMIPTEKLQGVVKNSMYRICVIDDTTDVYQGSYFKVVKISSNLRKDTLDVYTIDLGYPDKNVVTSFTVNDSQVFSIYYDYANKINQPEYIQRIDNNGNLINVYSPSYSNSNNLLKTTAEDKAWWTNMVNFPINVTLEIKGLLRPAILMSYIYLDSRFFGAKHWTSGYYIITKQTDSISQSGYRTILSLLKVGGEEFNAN